MNCSQHPAVAASAYCRACGRPLCTACQRNVRGVIYCEDCIANHLADADPAAARAIRPPSTGSPALAALLGFIPGVGAMYNGQFVKGFAHAVIFAAFVWAENAGGGDFFGTLIAFWIFYMVFDAYQTARARELGKPLPDPFGFERFAGSSTVAGAPASPGGESVFVAPGSTAPEGPSTFASYCRRGPSGAIFLILLGGIFLLRNIGIFEWRWFDRYFWEALVIGFGVWLLFRNRTRVGACHCARCQSRGMMAPAMMITVGVLGLLAATTDLNWGRTWPLFLIVLGVVKVLQTTASTEGHIEPGPVAPPIVTPPPTVNTGSPALPGAPSTEVHNG